MTTKALFIEPDRVEPGRAAIIARAGQKMLPKCTQLTVVLRDGVEYLDDLESGADGHFRVLLVKAFSVVFQHVALDVGGPVSVAEAIEVYIPVEPPAPSPVSFDPHAATARMVRLHQRLVDLDASLLADLHTVSDEATEVQRIMDRCPLHGVDATGQRVSPVPTTRQIVQKLAERAGTLAAFRTTVTESAQCGAEIAPALAQARQVLTVAQRPPSPLDDLQPIPHLDDLAHQRLAIHQQALDRCEALRKALATAVDVGTAHLPRFEQQVVTYARAVQHAMPQVLVAEYRFYLEAWRQAGQALGERLRTIEADAQQAGRALAITSGSAITWPTDPLQAPTLE